MKPPKRLALMLTGCALVAAAFVPIRAQTAPTPTVSADPRGSHQTRQSLIAPGDSPDLFLLYTGDVIGYLDPCG